MKKRTNTAVWIEKENRWCVSVQKNGQRKRFYSGTPGRTGQREANAKADAWLDDNIHDGRKKISALPSGWRIFLSPAAPPILISAPGMELTTFCRSSGSCASTSSPRAICKSASTCPLKSAACAKTINRARQAPNL